MREEFSQLGLRVTGFPPSEVARRIAEYDLADAILSPSQFVKDSFVEQGFPSDRVHVVPYGIPPPVELVPKPATDPEIFRVLYVGQLTPRKGVRYLLEAFDRLQHPRKELLIVGPPLGTKRLGGRGDS